MPKYKVDTALPIEFSEVCEVIWGPSNTVQLGTLNKTLFGQNSDGAFFRAAQLLGSFDPTYVGIKDRLSNFRGYQRARQGKYRLLVAGSNLKRSQDWGVTYTNTVLVHTGMKASAMSGTGQYMTAVIDGARRWTSSNYGLNWTERSGYQGWKCVAMSDSGQYQLTGMNNGSVFVSSDYGVTWPARHISNGIHTDAAMSDSGNIMYVTTTNYGILRSVDTGATFQTLTSLPTTGNYISITCSGDGQHVTALRANLEVWVSSNAGASWTSYSYNLDYYAVDMSKDGKYQSISIQDNISSGLGGIITSSDYGFTWSAKKLAGSNLRDIALSKDGYEQVAGVLAGTSRLYSSLDNGDTFFADYTGLVTHISMNKGYEETPVAPGTPVLTPVSVTNNSVTMSYTTPAGATYYTVYWKINGGSYSPISPVTDNPFTLTGLQPSSTYLSYIVAHNAFGSSGASNVITQTTSATPQTDTTPPSTPINVAGIGLGTSVDLYWEASTDNVGVAGYNIYRDGSFRGTSATTQFYDSINININTNYTYKVQAYDAAGNLSEFSTPVTINSGDII